MAGAKNSITVLPDIISEEQKGLNFEGFIIKLNQYADDTQFIMDGSKSSLEAAMTILNEFYYYSGLKIIIGKTLAVWLGNKAGSDDRICREYNLNWTNEPLNHYITYWT